MKDIQFYGTKGNRSHRKSSDGHGQMSIQPVREDRLRTRYSTSDPVYNHCLAVFMENFADYDNPRQESISETVIVIFGILFMGWCSKKKTL